MHLHTACTLCVKLWLDVSGIDCGIVSGADAKLDGWSNFDRELDINDQAWSEYFIANLCSLVRTCEG